MQQYIGFHLASSEYMIPILNVSEIVNMPAVTTIPQAPSYIKGITNLRGSVIPIVDLKRLINSKGENIQGDKVIVVAIGKVMFGIIVDRVTGVISLNDQDIEAPERVITENAGPVKGIAKLQDRTIVLLDTQKLLPVEDLSLFETPVVEVKELEGSNKIEVTKTVHTMGGKVMVKELHDAREYLSKKLQTDDPRQDIVKFLMDFMEAVASNDYEQAEHIVGRLHKAAGGDLFVEVGRITRKLHDSLKEFREAVDPGIKKIAREDVPEAVDKLQFVISKTEEAANRTMEIVERYLENTGELATHINNLQGPEESMSYIRSFKDSLDRDMTEILTSQQFQDITGQTLKKVMDLVNSIEGELLRLITTFGVKMEDKPPVKTTASSEKVTQADVEELLKEFGF